MKIKYTIKNTHNTHNTHNTSIAPQVGLEPTTSWLEVTRAIHCATGAQRPLCLLQTLRTGLEPVTFRLTVERSTNWANGEHGLTEIWTQNSGFKVHCDNQFHYKTKTTQMWLLQDVLEVGFEPTKHYAWHLKCHPFDRSGILADKKVVTGNMVIIHIIIFWMVAVRYLSWQTHYRPPSTLYHSTTPLSPYIKYITIHHLPPK